MELYTGLGIFAGIFLIIIVVGVALILAYFRIRVKTRIVSNEVNRIKTEQ